MRMSERYRLVFRGEVLEGQHKAVVKQRLGATLKLEGERLDAIFTGKAVTIRKDADTDTAARFQIAFKRAGARLRVLPVVVDAWEPELSGAAATSGSPPAQAGAFQLAPVGARLAEPRAAAPAPSVDIAHLSLASPGAVLGEPRPATAPMPDVSHLTVAALGSVLGGAAANPAPAEVAAPLWQIADAGVDLVPSSVPVPPPFDVDEIDFELAPPGSLLVDADDAPAPPPPDTSRLRLE
jgi:hypothetical protein